MHPQRTVLLSAIMIALSTSLTACGGGGGSNVKSDPPPVSVPPGNGSGGGNGGGGLPDPGNNPDDGDTGSQTPAPDNGGSDTNDNDPDEDADNGGSDDSAGSGDAPGHDGDDTVSGNEGDAGNGDQGNGSDDDQGGSDEDNSDNEQDDSDPGNGDDGNDGNDGPGGDNGSGGDEPPHAYDPRDPLPAPSPYYRTHLDYTNVTAAHELGLTGAGMKVGIIDSGANVDHPALQGKIKGDFDAVGSSLSHPSDPNGHGTITAQVLAGDHIGLFQGGVAPGVDLYVGRVIADGGYVANAGDALAWMNDNGVKIINNSWNLSYYLVPGAEFPELTGRFYDEARRTVANGGLIVFANGNDGKSDPGLYSLIPRGLSDVEAGFLTVGALGLGGQYNTPIDELASYSNACGSAMNWCLVAPGTMVVMETGYTGEDTEFNHIPASGTSFAAPQVSGAAALVWEAYPWMTNNQVRKTLLGTARDIGAPGVDEVFGYGVLDVGRAIQGFGSLEWGTETFDVSAGHYTFGNAIMGVGGIVKQGVGTLELSNDNTYQGATEVFGGTLWVSGSVASDVTTQGSGHLLLSGRINGNLDNQGRTTSVSGVVSGDWIQGDDSVLEAVLGAGSTVGGHFQADGTLSVVGLVSSDYIVKATETVVSAHSVGGAFDDTVFAAGLFMTGSVRYTGASVELDVIQTAPTSLAFMMATPQSVARTQQLEQAFAVGQVIAARGAEASASDNTGAFLSGLAQIQRVGTEVQALEAARAVSGQGRVLAASALLAGQGNADAVAFDRLSEQANARAGAFAGFGRDETSFSPSGWAFTRVRTDDTHGGLDWDIGNARAGIMGQSTRGHLNMGDNLGHYSLRSKSFGAYGRYDFGSWAILGQARATDGELDGSRIVELGSQAGSVGHVQDYRQWSIASRVEKSWETTAGTWSAYTGVSRQTQVQRASQEFGSTGFELGTHQARFASTTSQLGGRFASASRTLGQWGFTWSASAQYSYRHDHDDMAIEGYYLVAPEAVNSIQGVLMGQEAFSAQASANFTRGGVSAYLRGNATEGDGVSAWGVNAGFRLAW